MFNFRQDSKGRIGVLKLKYHVVLLFPYNIVENTYKSNVPQKVIYYLLFSC